MTLRALTGARTRGGCSLKWGAGQFLPGPRSRVHTGCAFICLLGIQGESSRSQWERKPGAHSSARAGLETPGAAASDLLEVGLQTWTSSPRAGWAGAGRRSGQLRDAGRPSPGGSGCRSGCLGHEVWWLCLLEALGAGGHYRNLQGLAWPAVGLRASTGSWLWVGGPGGGSFREAGLRRVGS